MDDSLRERADGIIESSTLSPEDKAFLRERFEELEDDVITYFVEIINGNEDGEEALRLTVELIRAKFGAMEDGTKIDAVVKREQELLGVI